MKIIYKNKTRKEIYESNIDCVKQIIEKLSKYLDFELNLKVYFEKENKSNNKVGAASAKKDGNWFELYIYDNTFNGCEEYLEMVLYHEFAHLYDIYHVTKNEQLNSIICKKHLKINENLMIYFGFKFWTEFFAFYKCFDSGLDKIEHSNTLLELANYYKKIGKAKTELENEIKKCNQNILKSKLDELINLIEEFNYRIASYIASIQFSQKEYAYSEKVKSRKEFKEVNKIIKDLSRLIMKMTHGTYGKYMIKRLYNIGSCIYKKIYRSFNIEMIANKCSVTYEFDLSREEGE